MSEWQPISTAPEDGTPILLWGTRGNTSAINSTCHAGRYSRGWWALGYAAYPICHATHWQPLPEAPK